MSTPESKPAVVMPRWLLWAGLVVAVGAVAGGYFVGPRGVDPVLASGPVGVAASPGVSAGAGVAGGGAASGPASTPGPASSVAGAGCGGFGGGCAGCGGSNGRGSGGGGLRRRGLRRRERGRWRRASMWCALARRGTRWSRDGRRRGRMSCCSMGPRRSRGRGADWRGEFVALPPEPLAAGGRTLTLASRSEGVEARSDGAVVVVVPEAPRATQAGAPMPVPAPVAPAPVAPAATPTAAPAMPVPSSAAAEDGRAPAAAEAKAAEAAKAPVVAVLVPSAGPARVLQEAPHAVGAVTLDVVDYDDKGAIRFSGSAPAAAAVRLYVDNGPRGRCSGGWVGALDVDAGGGGDAWGASGAGGPGGWGGAGFGAGGDAVRAVGGGAGGAGGGAGSWCSRGRICGGWRGRLMGTGFGIQ